MGLLSQLRHHPIRGLKTLALTLFCMYAGMNIAIVGPTLVSLQHRANASVTQSSYGLSFRSAGAGIGALLGIVLLLLLSSLTLTNQY